MKHFVNVGTNNERRLDTKKQKQFQQEGGASEREGARPRKRFLTDPHPSWSPQRPPLTGI